MPKICLSYRRADSSAIVGRIFDRLVDHCGAETVFMDIESIPFGTNFRSHIDDVLKDCDLLIAVVGPQWLGLRDGEPPRINAKTDPVRVEIQTALRRGVSVVPVLVEGAKMPTEGQLPRGLRQFASLNALEVESGRDFNVHVERLIRAAQQLVGGGAKMPSVTPSSASSLERPAADVQFARDTSHALGSLIGYLLASTFLLVLAHYLIVVRFDLSPLFLRVTVFAVPLAAGFVFFWQGSRGWGYALFLAISMGLLAVFLMLILISLVDGTPIIPATVLDWQEALEYCALITLAALAGNAIARFYRHSRS